MPSAGCGDRCGRDPGAGDRSQLVYTTARGREVVFWQSARTRKQSRPGVRVPSARAAGLAELVIVVDAHERYGYDFADKPVTTVRRGLSCGDYGLFIDGRLVAAVERKSLPDLVASLLDGTLKYQLTELAALPRAAVVVEDRYSEIFTLVHARPAVVADGLAELQVGFPNVASCSARPADWPRNTPTATWRRPTRGWPIVAIPQLFSVLTSHWPSLQISPSRIPPKSGRGPVASACPSPTAAGCGQRFDRPGTTPTAAQPSRPAP